MAVEVTIILTRMESSILFRNEEEWSSLWGFGRYNASGLQVFIDESLASFLFCRVKRVDLSNLRDEGVLEFNGVVERSMRRENIISLFREDVGEVSTKVWDRDFLGFLSLSELCQDGDFVDLFFQSSCQKVILTKRPVIFGRG